MSAELRAPAAQHTLRILKHLATQSGPVRASHVARDLSLPRSTVYQLLAVMQHEGFVVHYPEEGVWGLARLVSEIGGSFLRTERLERLGQPLMDALVRRLKLPIVTQLAVLHGTDVVYIGKAQAFRAPTVVSHIGVRLPAHLTATGRSMLAALPAAQIRAMFPHDDALIFRTNVGPRSVAALNQQLAVVRRRGWSEEHGDVTPEYASVGAAALDRNGYPAAAIGITFRTSAIDVNDWAELGEAVMEAAATLGQRIRGERQ